MKNELRNINKLIPLGVRGTYPVISSDFMKYGGHTQSHLFLLNNVAFLLDTGTGIINIDPYLDKIKTLYVLFTHYHIDHLMGLSYLFTISRKTDVVILQESTFEDPMFLISFVSEPFTPIPIGNFFNNIKFLNYKRHVNVDGIQISCTRLNHPGMCLSYLIQTGSETILTMYDNEITDENIDYFVKQASSATHVIFDSTFNEHDYIKGWGHSTFERALEFGNRLPDINLLCTHYNFTYDDKYLDSIESNIHKQNKKIMFLKEKQLVLL